MSSNRRPAVPATVLTVLICAAALAAGDQQKEPGGSSQKPFAIALTDKVLRVVYVGSKGGGAQDLEEDLWEK